MYFTALWKIFKYDYKLDSYRENIVSVLYLPIGYSKCTSDADIFPRAAPSEKYNASSVHLEHPQGRYNTSKIFARYDTSYSQMFFFHVDTRPCWLQSYWIREAERNHQEWLRVLCGTSLEKRKSKVLLKSCRN